MSPIGKNVMRTPTKKNKMRFPVRKNGMRILVQMKIFLTIQMNGMSLPPVRKKRMRCAVRLLPTRVESLLKIRKLI